MTRILLACLGIAMSAAYIFLFLPVDSYFFLLAAQCAIFALWAVSYNIVYGYMGEISFGHSAYFGLGAYALPLLMNGLQLPFLLGLLGGALIAGLAAALIGTMIRGTRGIYFAIATFVFAQAIYITVLKWTDFTGGDNGLLVSRPDWLSTTRSYAIFSLAIVAAAMAYLYRFVNSPAGRVIVAARENERRARQVGYDTTQYRIVAFIISGVFSGLAGGLFSSLIFFVSPDILYWHMSGQVIIMTIIGGAQAFVGPIVGAIFLVVFQDFVSGLSSSGIRVLGVNFASVGEHWLLLLGITFYAIILYEPDGIVGFIARVRVRKRKSDAISADLSSERNLSNPGEHSTPMTKETTS